MNAKHPTPDATARTVLLQVAHLLASRATDPAWPVPDIIRLARTLLELAEADAKPAAPVEVRHV